MKGWIVLSYTFKDDRRFAINNNDKKADSLLKKLVPVALIFAAVCFVLLTVTVVLVAHKLPSSQEILAHKPSLATVIYDRNGQEITKLFQENRSWVKLDSISPWMVKAILAAEDDKFYEHSGIRPLSILRAATIDLVFRGAHQGGSTITQQLARNLFLTKEKTIIRKIKEAVVALRLEKIYSKDQLLEMYLNTIYMGRGAYGIDSAAKSYYGKHAGELNIAESAILAGLVAAPERYSPFKNKDYSDTRKQYVLRRMLDLDWISKDDCDKALTEQPKLSKKKNNSTGFYIPDAPYFVSYLLFKHLLPTYGADQVYRGGLKVYTTIDIKVQQKAEDLVSKMPHEGALVALDPATGEILAMVGGRDYATSKFNRATQAYRQPGSSFKPFVYAAAIEAGYRSVDHLLDAPLKFENGWSPSNYSKNKYNGEITFMTGIAKSLNTVAVRLCQIVGVNSVIDFATRVGISPKYLPEDLSISLGSASVTPLEMCAAYSAFANNGNRVEPYGIKEIENNIGEILEQNTAVVKNAISPTTAVLVRSLLQQVMGWGTGAGANVAGYQSFGKTGTTNDWTDAWFAGGTPGIVAVVYTGNDNHKPLGGHATGTTAAAPVWKAFMTFAVKQLKTPAAFATPSDAAVEAKVVCTQTGFLATDGCKSTTIMLPAGNAPQTYCPMHGGSTTSARSDKNAPQLILAPVDSEEARYRYTSVPTEAVQDDETYHENNTPQEVNTAVEPQEEVVQSVKKGSNEKIPDEKSLNMQEKSKHEELELNRQYEELLKKYNLK